MNPIDILGFDPNSLLSNPVRSLAGIVDSANVIVGTDYGIQARWLYVGVSGNVTVKKWDGTTQTYLNLAAGVLHPICSIGVTAATATDIVWGS